MDKYLEAYNDVDDDLEDVEEKIIKERKEDNILETKRSEDELTIEDAILEKEEDDCAVNNENELKDNNGQMEYYKRNDKDDQNEVSERKDVEDDESNEEEDEFVISDEDQDFFRLRKRSREDTNEDKQEDKFMLLQPKIPKRTMKSRLVSYGEDEDEDEAVDHQDGVEECEEEVVNIKSDFTAIIIGTPRDEVEKDDQASKTIERLDDLTQHVKLPPRVATRCPKAMQDKVTFLHKKVTQEGMDLSFSIQGKKNFRNPSIYEKLLEYCRIDEQGTNYPAHLYNPTIFGPESNYKVLAENQNENEKRKKDLKQKRALEKSQAAKKTSKWDNPVANIINNLNNNNKNNTNNNVDASIKKVPSVGSLIKTTSS